MRIGFLWSLWACCPQTTVRQHVVVQAPPVIPSVSGALQQAFPNHDRKVIHFTSGLGRESGTVSVPLSSVYRARDDTFPQHHAYTYAHYFIFTRSPYASVMEYGDFCAMEDKLAHIVENYLQDEKNGWFVLMDDPFLATTIRGYLMPSSIRRATWVSTIKSPYSDFVMVDVGTNHPRL
jgi:hypothetical protein